MMFARLGIAQVFSAFGIFNYDRFMGHNPTVSLGRSVHLLPKSSEYESEVLAIVKWHPPKGFPVKPPRMHASSDLTDRNHRHIWMCHPGFPWTVRASAYSCPPRRAEEHG